MDSMAHLNPALGRLSRPQIEDLQTERLLRMLPDAMARSGMVHERWTAAGLHPRDVRSLSEFSERVPFMNQDAIRQYRVAHGDPLGGISRMVKRRLTGIASTSGTTGNPTPVPLSPSSILERTTTRDLSWCAGLKRNEFLMYTMFAFRAGIEPWRFRGMGVTQIMLDHLPQDIPLLIDASRRYRPSVLYMLSAPLVMMIERYAEQHRVDLSDVFSSYRVAVIGGERLTQHTRETIQSWGMELHEMTSLGDVGSAMDCSAHAGFHGWEDFAILEHLDPKGNEPAADGEVGELVVTALDDPAFTLVRYRTDDLVRLTREPCRCGLTHARFSVMGRKGDEIRVGARSVFPKDVWPVIEQQAECPGALFQLGKHPEPLDALHIKVGYDASLLKDAPAALSARVVRALQDQLQVDVRLQLVDHAELLKLGPPHKIPRVFKL